MNKTQAIRWLIEHRRADVPLQAVIHRLKAALSFDPQSMALLKQIAAETRTRPETTPAELPASRTPSRVGLLEHGACFGGLVLPFARSVKRQDPWVIALER